MSPASGAPPGSEIHQSDSAFALQSPDANRQQVIRILVREHYAILYRLAREIMGDKVQEGELARGAIAEACERRAEYQGQVSPSVWLIAILWRHGNRTRSRRNNLNLELLLHQYEQLSLEDIAFIVRKKPEQIARQLDGQSRSSTRVLPPLDIPTPDQIDQLTREILQEKLRHGNGIPLSPELGWLSLALFAIFILFARYHIYGNNNPGQNLFPSPEPTLTPAPTPTAVSGIPFLEFDIPLESRQAESGKPPISSSERLVAFVSNIENLDGRFLSYFTFGSDIAFSPGGGLLAVGNQNGSIHLWEPGGISEAYTLDSHNNPVTGLAFSPLVGSLNGQPTGQYILASADSGGKVLLWQVSGVTGTLRIALEEHPGNVHAIAYSPNGKYLAVAHDDGIWLWELRPTFAVLIRQWKMGPGLALAFHPGDDVLATANAAGESWLVSVPEGDILARLIGNTGELSALAWTPDGQTLATGDLNGEVNLWGVALSPDQNTEITLSRRFSHHEPIHDLSFSHDGDYLAAGTNSSGLWMWNLLQNNPTQFSVPDQQLPVTAVAYSSNARWITAGAQTGGMMLVIDQGLNVPGAMVSGMANPRYFRRLPFDEYVEQQIIAKDDGQANDPNTPAVRYAPAAREFSSLTGVYVRIPDVLPPEAVYLGQVNPTVHIAGLHYDLPWSDFQNVRLIIYVPTGYEQRRIEDSDFPDHRVGMSAQVEAVEFGLPDFPTYGELASGGWAYFSDQIPTVTTQEGWLTVDWSVRWQNHPAWMALRWQSANALFEISVTPKEGVAIKKDIPLISKEEFLKIAGDMIIRDR